MRIGNVYGPYVGMYWIDPVARTITFKAGTKGVTAEITKELTQDEAHGLMDGLMERPAHGRSAGTVMKSRRIARMLTPIEGGRKG